MFSHTTLAFSQCFRSLVLCSRVVPQFCSPHFLTQLSTPPSGAGPFAAPTAAFYPAIRCASPSTALSLPNSFDDHASPPATLSRSTICCPHRILKLPFAALYREATIHREAERQYERRQHIVRQCIERQCIGRQCVERQYIEAVYEEAAYRKTAMRPQSCCSV